MQDNDKITAINLRKVDFYEIYTSWKRQ